EKAEYLGRFWRIDPKDNLSLANLKKSLEDKHGATTSGFDERHYDRSGVLQPKAFQPVCGKDVHLQDVRSYTQFTGTSAELTLKSACGSHVKIAHGEDYDAKGRASYLEVGLFKADVAYESFWATW